MLGRDFAYPLLRDVSELNEPALQTLLERLADANILFVEATAPHSNYRFKHSLIQDAAYDSLLKSRRQALHRRAAEALVDANAEPEAIAHHFTQGCETDLGIEWWGKAGDQALRRSAFQEAIAHLGKAIEMADGGGPVGKLPAIGPHASDQRRLRGAYARALIFVKGVAAEETKAALERAQEFAASHGAVKDEVVEVRARWDRHFLGGEFKIAQEVVEQALRLAEDQGRAADGAHLQALLGTTCLFRGDPRRARTLLEQALGDSASDLDVGKRTRPSSGAETIAFATPCLSLAAWQLGDAAGARRLIEQSEDWAGSVGGSNPATAVLLRATLESWRSDPEATLAAADRIVAMASESGMAIYVALGAFYKSWAIGRLRDAATGLRGLQEPLQSLDRIGVRVSSAYFHGLAADLEGRAGDMTAALKEIDQGLASSGSSGEHWTDPYLHCLRGSVLQKHDPSNPKLAEDAFQTAIAIAKERGARSYELLASLSLARLYQSTNRPADGHAVLAPALKGFSPTPEMPEIAEAEALLAALEEARSATRSEIDG